MSGARRRIGVLGGTFDPPHIGHLLVAVNVRFALSLDEIRLVVANHPWQKADDRAISPAVDRLAMTTAAVEGLDGVTVSAIEIERGGPSYSVDTLEEFRSREPEAELFLVVGADAAGQLETWHRYEEIPSLATVVVVDRPGLTGGVPPSGWPTVHVEVPRVEISSTDLRARVTDGRPLRFLMPESVATCITERRLYGLAGT